MIAIGGGGGGGWGRDGGGQTHDRCTSLDLYIIGPQYYCQPEKGHKSRPVSTIRNFLPPPPVRV